MRVIDGYAYERLVRAVRRLLRRGQTELALDVARVAVDLTQNGATEVLHVSPSGLSIGDRIKIRTRHHQIAQHTPGNIVGFAKGQILALFFPPAMSNGVLTLVGEDDISFLSKPAMAGPWALMTDDSLAPTTQGPGAPSVTLPGGDSTPPPAPLPGPIAVPPPVPPKHAAVTTRRVR